MNTEEKSEKLTKEQVRDLRSALRSLIGRCAETIKSAQEFDFDISLRTTDMTETRSKSFLTSINIMKDLCERIQGQKYFQDIEYEKIVYDFLFTSENKEEN